MKRLFPFGLFVFALAISLASVRADDEKKLSPENLDVVDQLGYFTPAFKQAVHDYIFAKQSLAATKAEQEKMANSVPALQKEASQLQASAVSLRQDLARYEHPEEIDFDTLQSRTTDANTKPESLLALAQAYVWTFPTSPHAADAQKILSDVQKKIADQKQAAKEAEAARVAAHAELVRRAQARDLSLAEWRSFLRDMSQDDLVKLMGHPSVMAQDDWTYGGAWTTDPTTNRKVGLEITFDAGRVINVDEKPSGP